MQNFNFNKWNTILGWSSFAIALITYSLTVEPTMSFRDCGEYISTAAKLEVGHPPGAPFYQILGAFFSMFVKSLMIIVIILYKKTYIDNANTDIISVPSPITKVSQE